MTALAPAPDCVSQAVGEELIVLDTASGRYYRLNATARLVYEQIAQGTDEGDIGALLAERYRVSAEDAAADVDLLCRELRRLGVLVSC